MASISFDEIASGTTVRVTVIQTVQFLCIFDMIMHLCGKNVKWACRTWRRLSNNQKDELARDENSIPNQICYFQFPGQGQRRIPVATIEASMKIIMVLPGKRAKVMRLQAADILSRYIHGKDSLIEEIITNKMIGPVAAYSNLAQKVVLGASQYTEGPQVSYIYGSKSDAFPGLIKIGKSAGMAPRLTTLNTSCKPKPHSIVALAPTYNAPRDEVWAHTFFSAARREGEFFEVKPEEVRAFFANHITTQFHLELSECISRVQGE